MDAAKFFDIMVKMTFIFIYEPVVVLTIHEHQTMKDRYRKVGMRELLFL